LHDLVEYAVKRLQPESLEDPTWNTYEPEAAKRRNGDATGGDADMAAAKALDPDVEKGM
jgi:hypothetical protein